MAKQSFKISMKEAKGISYSQFLSMPLAEKQRIVGGLSRQAANIVDRNKRAGVNSKAIGQFERSIRAQNVRFGLKGLSTPTGPHSEIKVKEEGGTKIRYTSSYSLDRQLNERAETLLKLIQGQSTVRDARKELKDFRERFNWPNATFKDMKDFWAKYDDQMRAEAESSGEGNKSPTYQETLADWMMGDYDGEEVDYVKQKMLEDKYISQAEYDNFNIYNYDPNTVVDYLVSRWKKQHKPSSGFKGGIGSKV